MNLPPLNALRAFECAARTGSFSAAGAELGVTAAAVSLQVRNLEDWLNLQLFVRKANQLRITDAGRDYYQNAASALAEIARFTDALTQGDRRRPFVISATPALAQLWLPQRLAVFAQLRPDVPVELRTEAEDQDLELHGIDVRLSYGGELPDYASHELFTDQLVPVVSGPGALGNFRRIDVNWGTRISSVPGWRQWSELYGLLSEDIAPIAAASVPDALALCTAGIGVTLLPETVVSMALKSGIVRKCDPRSIQMPRPYVMLHAHYKTKSRRLMDFQKALLTG
ncbi:LysR family transcriptional regulator [Tropicibacter sp. Alg240-R139]|uniref:LysR family transcriptional regulator n=1 Tax=Tropicibacter sp. Alg240-R139 TaxID=2305991 RepID=UPI0013DFCC17|nr:LysR family transcriptional regulator [Tropicibacter sp. Alg240-R139]